MLLRDVAYRDLSLGDLKRPDGREYEVNARFYEMPETYSYWLVNYDAHHKSWGHMRYTLLIPKTLATTPEQAMAIVKGSALTHVHASLEHATDQGRSFEPVFSADGWVIT